MLSKISQFSPKELIERYRRGDERTRLAIRNSRMSLLAKCISIFCTLAIVPLTINYVNPTRYGIWMTLSGMIGWMAFFDLGFGNGFRNRFAEAKAKGDTLLARQYLSTTYFAIFVIMSLLYSIISIGNQWLNWSGILNVDPHYNEELRKVFFIVSSFFCLNMVVNIFSALVSADQRIGLASLISGIGQIVSLIVIFILTRTTEGSLITLATYYSGIPMLVILAFSIIMYSFGRYKPYRPRFSDIRLSLVKHIMGLGLQFFIINFCLILVFQLVNFVIMREVGAESVTIYNVANKYFNVLYMLVTISVTPLWSAFTDAFTKKDFQWMKNTFNKLSKFLTFLIGAYLLLLLISPFIYQLWVGDSVHIKFIISLFVMLLSIGQSVSTTYMYMVNGIGAIRLQLVVYLFFAIISWPMMVLGAQHFGLLGILIIPTIVYFTQGLLAKAQLQKILSNKATGIWIK